MRDRRPLVVTALSALAALLLGTGVVAAPAAAVDSGPPAPAYTSAPTGTTEATWAALSFAADEAASYECALDAGTFAPCEDPVRGLDTRRDLSLGTHVHKVRAVSATGARSSETTATWTVVAGPVLRWISKPSGTIGNAHVTAVFAAPEAHTYECSLDGAGFSSCSGYTSGTHVMPHLTDGDHVLQVRARTASGAAGPVETASFTVASPLTVEWVSRPTGDLQSPAVTAAFRAHAAHLYECNLDGAGFSSCTGYTSGTHVMSSLRNGTHVLQVRARSYENVVGPVAETTFTVGVPLTVEWVSRPEGTLANSAVTAVFSAPAAYLYECNLDGAGFSSCTGYTAGLHAMTSLRAGSHVLQVRARSFENEVGPVAETTFTVAPALTVEWASQPQGTIANDAVTAAFAAPAGYLYECDVDGAGWTSCSGYTNGTHRMSGLRAGEHVLKVRARSYEGDTGPVAEARFTVAPDLAISWASRPTGSLASTSATAVFSAPAAYLYECNLDGAGFTSCTGYTSGTHVMTGLVDGEHVLEVRARSFHGDLGPTARTTFTVASPLAVTVHGDPSSAPGGAFAATFSAPAGYLYECQLDGAGWSSCTGYTAGTHRLDGLTGSHVLDVRARDAVGNVGAPTSIPFATTAGGAGLDVVLAEPSVQTPTGDVAAAWSAADAAYYTCSVDGNGPQHCGPTTSLDDLTPGEHTVSVTAYDAEGTPGAPADLTVSVSAPEVPAVVTAPNGTVPEAGFAVAVAAPHASTYECALDDQPMGGCAPYAERTGISDGEHTLTYRTVLPSGARSADLVLGFTVASGKAVSVTSPLPSQVRTTSTAVAVSAPSAAYYQCRLDEQQWQFCASSQELWGLADGPHTLTYRAFGAGGTTAGPELAIPFTVDSRRPVVVTSGLPQTVPTSYAAVAVVAEGAAYYECRLDDRPWQYCSAVMQEQALPEGPHVFHYRSYTSGSATPGPELAIPFTVAATRPTVVSSGLPPVVPTSWIAVSVTSALVASFECRLDEESWAHCAPSFERSALAEGGHVLQYRATASGASAPGAVLSIPFTVDTDPVVSVTSALPTPPEVTRSSGVALAVTAPGAAHYECRLDGAAFGHCAPWFEHGHLADGPHTVDVRAFDANGAAGATLSVPFTVDTTPVTSLVSAPSPTELLTAKSYAFSYVSPGATSYDCRLDGGAWSACGTSTSGTLLLKDLAVGRHLLEVRATSDRGTGSPLQVPFRIRKDAPETALVSGPPARTRSTTAEVVVTGTDPTPTTSDPGPAALTYACTVDGTARACSNPLQLTGLTEGPHTVTVAAVNDEGRPDPTPVSHSWTVDLTPPSVAVTGGPTGTVTTASATFGLQVDSTAVSTTCSLDGGTPEPCAGEVSYTGLADGPHALVVRATDDVGNAATAERRWTVDTTPPAVVFTSGPGASTEETSATFAFTVGDAVTVTCSLDGSSPAACSSPKTYDGLVAGPHELVVLATDASGLTGRGEYRWTVGGEVPVPDTTITAAPEGVVGTDAAQVEFVADVPGATFTCSLDDAQATACTSPLTVADLADGAHSVVVTAATSSGSDTTPARATWTVDTVVPVVTITSGPPSTTTDRDASIAFTVTDASAVETTCSLDGADPVECASPKVLTGLEVGPHTLLVLATDAAGGADSAEHSWTVVELDPVPDTTLEGQPTGTVGTATVTMDLLSDVATATFECAVDGGAYAPCESPWTTPALTDGPHTASVRAVTNGGPDPTPATAGWTTDLTAPVVAITSGPTEGSTAITDSARFGFTVSDRSPVTTTCRLDAAAATACTTTSPTYSALSSGRHVFTVSSTDAVSRTTTVTRTWTVGTPAVAVSVQAQTTTGSADSAHGLGEDYRYALTAASTGTARATTVTARLVLGSSIALRSVPSGCTFSSGTLSCSGGTMNPGTSRTWLVPVEGKLSCTRWGSPTAETITGTSAAEVICGGGGADTITGGGGNDRIWGYGPAVAASTLLVTPSAAYGPGTRTTARPGVPVTIGGTDGADTITTTAGADFVYGQDGDDRIKTGAGTDTVHGGAGADTVEAEAGNDVVRGEAGADVLNGGIGDDDLYGGADADRLLGSDGVDDLYGDAGNDFVYGEIGNDRMHGGTGDDDLYGGDNDDTVNGDDGQDLLYGGYGVDRMSGGNGHDNLRGSFGNDVLAGGYGRDRVYGEDGNDSLDGGPALGTASAAPNDHWNQLFGGVGDDACSNGPGTGTSNTDFRDASCERLATGGAAAKGTGWPNGSRAELDRL